MPALPLRGKPAFYSWKRTVHETDSLSLLKLFHQVSLNWHAQGFGKSGDIA
jgi:hypothetical protein